MKSSSKIVVAMAGLLALTACGDRIPVTQAYWQRVEDSSAMYMTGPKAQQQLDEDIALCVHEVDELVELNAYREATPPDTHSEYFKSLKQSGDLSYYDTPTRYGDKKVAHKDFQDFEGCMRSKGWERVRFVRYQSSQKAQTTYKETQNIRKWGGVPGGNESAVEANKQKEAQVKGSYDSTNK